MRKFVVLALLTLALAFAAPSGVDAGVAVTRVARPRVTPATKSAAAVVALGVVAVAAVWPASTRRVSTSAVAAVAPKRSLHRPTEIRCG